MPELRLPEARIAGLDISAQAYLRRRADERRAHAKMQQPLIFVTVSLFRPIRAASFRGKIAV
jgi:hypothetical protein